MHQPIIRTAEQVAVEPDPTPEASLPTITIPLVEFTRIVNIAKPFAGTDDLLRVFTGIHFYEHDGLLYAEATDRYAMVRVSSKIAAPSGFDVNLAAKDCAAVIARFKPMRRAKMPTEVTLSLTFDDGLVQVEMAGGVLAVGRDTTLTLAPIQNGENGYPKLGHLFAANANAEPAAQLIAFDPRHLGKLPDAGQMRVVGVNKPVGFYGDGWAALIQPMRFPDDMTKAWAA